jgi:hypothetical protein
VPSQIAQSFRPRRCHVVIVTLGLLGLGFLGVLLGSPVYITAIGAALLAMAPCYAWIALRTEIQVASDGVQIRTVRGLDDFKRGDARVRVRVVMSGLTRTAPLLTVERISDGRKVSVSLISFPRADQKRIPDLVRRELRPDS